jgi:hypothetical protein
MVANVVPMVWVALHVSVFNHLPDKDVKIVSLNIRWNFLKHDFNQASILALVNHVKMEALVNL